MAGAELSEAAAAGGTRPLPAGQRGERGTAVLGCEEKRGEEKAAVRAT